MIAFINHVFHIQAQLYLLIMSSSPHSQQTNAHLGTRLSRKENTTKLKVQGHTANFRVEFTLTKLQKIIKGPRAETNYSCSQNLHTDHKERNISNLQANRAR